MDTHPQSRILGTPPAPCLPFGLHTLPSIAKLDFKPIRANSALVGRRNMLVCDTQEEAKRLVFGTLRQKIAAL